VTLARAGKLPALCAVMTLLVWIGFALAPPHAAAQEFRRDVYLVVIDNATMGDLLAAPELRVLASTGGAALLSDTLPLRDAIEFLDANGASPRLGPGIFPEALHLSFEGSVQSPDGTASLAAIRKIAQDLRDSLSTDHDDDALVIVASGSPPRASAEARDVLTGVIVGRGRPLDLAAAMRDGSAPVNAIGSLTSDSARRAGVVTTRDVATSIADYLSVAPLGGDPGGAIIRSIPGPPPFDLHERYLEMRRMVVPIETASGVYVTIAGLVGIALLWSRRGPKWLVRAVAFSALSTSALVISMLGAGHLPTLSYATVIPFLVAITLFATWALVPLARRDALLAPAAVGAAVLAYFAVEAALGWTAALTTLHGGSELDGGRFYGLPNAFIGLLIGASVYVAHRLRPRYGFALIVGVGLFAGLPYIGANLGGSVSLFAAAGIWLAIRERQHLGWWKGIAVVAGTVALGTAVILLAHRLAPAATHITRFEESSGGIAGAWSTFVDRLGVGWRLIRRNPFGLIPVVGLLACLWLVLRPPTPMREALAAYPGWRDVVVTIVLGGIVAYVANDSGAAACGMAFALGFGGLMYVSLTLAAAKMERT
jgi:hypothetical protein